MVTSLSNIALKAGSVARLNLNAGQIQIAEFGDRELNETSQLAMRKPQGNSDQGWKED